MLLTVYEAARILGVEPRRVYYEPEMCHISGFVKLTGTWRLSENALEELYGRFYQAGAGEASGDTGLRGFAERLADVRAQYLANPARSPFTRVPGRGRERQCAAVGSDRVAGRAGRRRSVRHVAAARCEQPELWADGDFW